jgi:hypothetical protein
VLGQLTGQDKPHGGLDLARADGRLLVVGGELGSLGCDALEDVVDEGVQDGHGAVGDTSVWVHLLEDWSKHVSVSDGFWKSGNYGEVEARTLVDVGAVGLLPGLGALLLLAGGSGLLAGLFLLGRSLASWCLAGGGGGLERESQRTRDLK